MSTLFEVYEHEFQGRRPSLAQVKKVAEKAIKGGAMAVQISWGENRIDLDFHPNQHTWYGHGWIKSISGDDMAKELNKSARRELLDNFNYVGSHHHY
jgi:hypothetical protein